MRTSSIKIQIEFVSFPQTLDLSIYDRNCHLGTVSDCRERIMVFTSNLEFPNQLRIELSSSNATPKSAKLLSLDLGGLFLPKNILDQICQFCPTGSDHPMITTEWHSEGTVIIDFFANNWIEYHLLYGNKIEAGKKI